MSEQSSASSSVDDSERTLVPRPSRRTSIHQHQLELTVVAQPQSFQGYESPMSDYQSSRGSISLASERRERLREERDRQERIQMFDIYDNGTLGEMRDVAGGDPRDVSRYRPDYEPHILRHDLRQPPPSSSVSTRFFPPGQTPNQSMYSDNGLRVAGRQSHPFSTVSRDTTPTTVVQHGNAAGYYAEEAVAEYNAQVRLAQELESQREIALAEQRERNEEQAAEDRREEAAEAQRRAAMFLTQYDETEEELNRIQEDLEGTHDDLTSATEDWLEDLDEEDQERLIEHAENIERAFPTSRYQRFRSLFWLPGVPAAVRDAAQQAIDLEKRRHRLWYEGDQFLAWSRGNEDFRSKRRETWPPVLNGEFGEEFDDDNPEDDNHVCKVDSFRGFHKLQDLDLEATCEAQQAYLIAELKVRLLRLQQAHQVLQEQGSDAAGHHKQIFASMHCWLVAALDHVHDRANHPRKIQDDFAAQSKEFWIGDLDQWKEFEMRFRATIGTILSYQKKAEWAQRIGHRHWNPLTARHCHEGGPSMNLCRGPAWLRDDDQESQIVRQSDGAADAEVLVAATPTPTQPQSQPESARSAAQESVSRISESPYAGSIASGRNTDADGDEEMHSDDSDDERSEGEDEENDQEDEGEMVVRTVKQPLRGGMQSVLHQTSSDIEEDQEESEEEPEDEFMSDDSETSEDDSGGSEYDPDESE